MKCEEQMRTLSFSCSVVSFHINSHAFLMLGHLGRSFWRCSLFTSTDRTTSEFDGLTQQQYCSCDWWTGIVQNTSPLFISSKQMYYTEYTYEVCIKISPNFSQIFLECLAPLCSAQTCDKFAPLPNLHNSFCELDNVWEY